MADLYCDDLQGDYQGLSCGIERARIVSLGLVDPDNPLTDPSDDAEWVAATGASPQTAWVITEGLRGEMSRASDTEDEGFGLDATELTGAEHSVTLQVKGLKSNVNWTNIVNKKKWNIALAYSEGDMFYVTAPATVIFRPVVGSDLKTTVYWDVAIKWTDINNPSVYTTPNSLLPT